MQLKTLIIISTVLISFGVHAQGAGRFFDQMIGASRNAVVNTSVMVSQARKAFVDCQALNALVESNSDTNSHFMTARDPSLPNATQMANIIQTMRSSVNGRQDSSDAKQESARRIEACSTAVYRISSRNAAESSAAVETVLSAGSEVPPVVPEIEARSETQSACSVMVEADDCGIPESPATSHAIAIAPVIPKVPRFSETDCQCAKQKFRNQFPIIFGRDSAKRELRGKLNDLIIESYGKKFINKFASNLEDLNFFLGEKATVFNVAGSEQNVGSSYQCNKYADYENLMKTVCEKNGVPLQEGSRRIDKMLSSVGRPEYTNFNEHLERVADDVLNIRTTAGGRGNERYTRARYDALRYTQVENNSDIIFVDRMMAKILQGPLKQKFLTTLASKRNAEEAFLEILIDESIKPDSDVASILSDESFASTPFAQNFKPLIIEGNKLKIKNSLTSSFRTTAANHPGLKFFLNDKEGIKDLVIPSDISSLHKFLEEQNVGGYIDRKFKANCDKMQAEMAEMACIKPRDILGNISALELDKLAHHEPELRQDLNTLNVLLCEEAKRESTPLLSDLDVEHGVPSHLQSDYLSRLVPTLPMDRFSAVVKENEKPNSPIAAIANAQSDHRMSVSDGERDSYSGNDRLGFDHLKTPTKTSSSNTAFADSKNSTFTDRMLASAASLTEKGDATTELSRGSNAIANGMGSSEVPATNFYSNTSLVPSTSSQNNVVSDEALRNARSELRESILNDDNKQEVNRLLSNVDDATTLELARLREENLKARQEILELSTKAEQDKLKVLQARMKQLEEEKVIAAANPNSNTSDPVASTGKKRKKGTTDRSIASTEDEFDELPGSQVANAGAVNGGNSGGSASPGAVSSRATISGSSGTASNAIGASFNNGGALILSGNAVSQSQEVRSQEINNELLKYLNQSEPDISTLMNIKTSGMVYKFQVMRDGQLVEQEVALNYSELSEDLKKLIDQKIASKKGGRSLASIDEEIAQVRRIHSYTALRLIINQQSQK